MRTIFEQVIARGDYDLTAMLQNIDRYHIEGKLRMVAGRIPGRLGTGGNLITAFSRAPWARLLHT